MCAKNTNCCSDKSKPMAGSACCSASAAPVIKSIGSTDAVCTANVGSEGSSSLVGGDIADEDTLNSSSADDSTPHSYSLYTQSWKVIGMDCPSCARKIETAVNNIDGVEQVKVLFATEKLVVKYRLSSLSDTIEQVVINSGFKLGGNDHQAAKNEQITFNQIIKQNAAVLSLAAAMFLSFILRPVFPQFSEWSFVAICLLGLIPVVKKAIVLARSGTPFSIETLMSVAAIGALYLGESVEAAMVLLLFLLGEKLEAFASSRARSGVQSLMKLVPEETTKIVNGERVTVAVSELSPKDKIEVAVGERLPADGIIHNSASFDESALTGESIPVEHQVGEQVLAGSVVVDKVVQMEVTSKQGENAIDRVLHLIEEAESHKAPLERFLDRFSRWYTPAMMILALFVIITPPLLFAQPWQVWVYKGLALLLIACPCALVISTPAAITSGLAVAAKHGALIKGGAALEQLGRVEVVAFDKTGTLTKGKPEVTDVLPLSMDDEESLLRVAAAIEVGSSHPLALSLVRYAQNRNITLPEANERQAIAGVGVKGSINGENYSVLSPSKIDRKLSEETIFTISQLEKQGKTAVLVCSEQTVLGVIAWQDTLREEAKDAVAKLHHLGIDTLMLTGDNERSAKAIGDAIGIRYRAGLLPEDKVRYVQELASTKQVAMVGDGINDAPAMKASSIGIAMGSGTDVALEAADSALTHNRLTEIAGIITLSKATLKNIRQNISLALGLKALFLITSLLGITGLWMAVLADSGATFLVTLNALRLLRLKS